MRTATAPAESLLRKAYQLAQQVEPGREKPEFEIAMANPLTRAALEAAARAMEKPKKKRAKKPDWKLMAAQGAEKED